MTWVALFNFPHAYGSVRYSLENTYHFDPFKKFLHKKDMPKFSQFCIYFSMHNIEHSMTQLLSHTIAHFTGPSFMLKANNQPYKKILDVAFSWVNIVKNSIFKALYFLKWRLFFWRNLHKCTQDLKNLYWAGYCSRA